MQLRRRRRKGKGKGVSQHRKALTRSHTSISVLFHSLKCTHTHIHLFSVSRIPRVNEAKRVFFFLPPIHVYFSFSKTDFCALAFAFFSLLSLCTGNVCVRVFLYELSLFRFVGLKCVDRLLFVYR